MLVDAYASAEHYFRHLAPVWEALPSAVQGRIYSPKASCSWGEPLPPRWALDHVVLVASYVDAVKCRPRSVIYAEHGAGQSYGADERTAANPSYSGGDGLDNVILFLAPSEAVCERWRRRYPGTPAVAVGCPALDMVHAGLVVP